MKLYAQQVKGTFITNTYFYINEKTRHGCIIDPGAQEDLILKIIKDNNWKIDAILITHAHFDHIGALNSLVKTLNIPYYIHEKGIEYLKNNELNLSARFNLNFKINYSPIILKNRTELFFNMSEIKLDAIPAPGHSLDSVIYYDPDNKIAFVGDILYDNKIGIWSFPGGNKKVLINSIKEKICSLPSDVICFSGHSSPIEVKKIQNLMYNQE